MKERMVPAQQLSDAGEDLVRLAAAKDAEIAALQRTFDLQWEADQRAIKRWQEAHTGSELIWPDRADMVVWLMEQLDAATATFDDEEAAHQDTLRLWRRRGTYIAALTEQRDRAMKVVQAAREARICLAARGTMARQQAKHELTRALTAFDTEAAAETEGT